MSHCPPPPYKFPSELTSKIILATQRKEVFKIPCHGQCFLANGQVYRHQENSNASVASSLKRLALLKMVILIISFNITGFPPSNTT